MGSLPRRAAIVACASLWLGAPASAAPVAGGSLRGERAGSPLLEGASSSTLPSVGGRTMSDDGRYVVFSSDADSLRATPFSNVFRRDLTTGETALVSTGPNGPANGSSLNPSVSADGTKVAFVSGATNLVDGVSIIQGVYVRDLVAGTTELVSRGDGPAGAPANSGFNHVISGDGTAVAFSTGEALPAVGAPTDTNNDIDVYVRDGTSTYLASVARNGTEAKGSALTPGIDYDGTAVAFLTTVSLVHTNSVFPDNGTSFDLYLHERTGETYLVSHGSSAEAGVVLGQQPAVSGSGKFVAWTTNTAVDSAADTNGVADVYATNLTTDAVALFSRGSMGGAVGNAASGAPAFPTGATDPPPRLAFQTAATNLGPDDGNGSVRDVAV